MDRITGTAVADIGGGKRGFQDQILSTGGGSQEGTVVTANWLTAVQEEILNVIEQSGQDPDDGDLTQLSQAISTLIRNTVPAGAGMVWYANVPPPGWLECDGSLLSRTAYADLFAVIGATFGAGDGATTFALPDFRGEFLRGWDHGHGTDAGRAFGSWQGHALQHHNHKLPTSNGTTAIASIPDELFDLAGGANAMAADNNTAITYDDGQTKSGQNGGTWASETRPRNVAAMFIIKF